MAAAPKVYRLGTHRVAAPRETLARFAPFLPAIGVTRVATVTGLDVIGIPVVMVCRPNARSLSVAQGKGLDLAAAKASGIGEALESWHAENILRPLRLATYGELARVAPVVDVEALPRLVSSRFHHDLSILWIEGNDLVGGESVWLPFESVNLDFRVPGPQGSGCFLADGTGLAAGNHLLEAVSHALCEVVERDAIRLWKHRGPADQGRRRVDLESIDSPAARSLLGRFAAAGVAVGVWDATTDIGLATFVANIIDARGDQSRRVPAAGGYGCHPDREVALCRALTEAAQSRLTFIAGSRDDVPPATYQMARDPELLARQRADLVTGRAGRSFSSVPDGAAASIDEDVARQLDLLRTAGFGSVVMVDLTRPDVGVPVVRIVIPGLEGMADRVDGYRLGPRAQAVLAGAGAERA